MSQSSTSNPFNRRTSEEVVRGLFCCDQCFDELEEAVYDPIKEIIKWECRNTHHNEVNYRV